MKNKATNSNEKPQENMLETKTITIERAKEIMKEEGIEYTGEELKQVLDFISEVILITTTHFERVKQKETKVISINTNRIHETKSIPLYSSEHRRAS